MPWLRKLLPVVAVVVAACGPAPSPSASPSRSAAASGATSTATSSATPGASAAASPREIAAGSSALAAGTYTRASFRPTVVFAIGDGWTSGTLTDGFFDVQQDPGTPDVIAVQFAHVDGIAGTGRSIVPVTSADAAVTAIHDIASLVVVDESASAMSGLDGRTVVIENRGTAPAVVLSFQAGAVSIDPGRKLWISLFDTTDGLLAVMVGGSVAHWDRALTAAEPVLESVVIGS